MDIYIYIYIHTYIYIYIYIYTCIAYIHIYKPDMNMISATLVQRLFRQFCCLRQQPPERQAVPAEHHRLHALHGVMDVGVELLFSARDGTFWVMKTHGKLESQWETWCEKHVKTIGFSYLNKKHVKTVGKHEHLWNMIGDLRMFIWKLVASPHLSLHWNLGSPRFKFSLESSFSLIYPIDK